MSPSISSVVAILHYFLLAGHVHAFLLPHQPPTKAFPPPLSPIYRNQQVSITTRSITTALKSTASELERIVSNLDDDVDLPILHVAERIGSGSYGTVHKCYLINSKKDITPCVAKRSWSFEEMQASVPKQINDADRIIVRTGLASNSAKLEMEEKVVLSEEEVKIASERCAHYWEVERHCFQKLKKCSDEDNDELLEKAIPTFLGVFNDDGSGMECNDLVEGYGLISESKEGGWFNSGNENRRVGHDWMVFETVESFEEGEDVLTLLDAMDLDWKDQHSTQKHTNHLDDVKVAMGLPESSEFGDVLDRIFESLLENMKAIHERNIVHRDLKPGNLLCDAKNQRLRLIDFGSAADIDPSPASALSASNIFSGGKVRVGLDEGIVALSPVYAAPETFVKAEYNPTSFDVFSAALIVCQLLFNLLDERTDAGFCQQLKEVDYNLDSWLENQLHAKLRPSDLDDALEYLGERRGLWRVLKKMLQPDPMKRISSDEALRQFKEVIGLKAGDIEWSDPIIIKVAQDEAYLETVIDSFERCDINYDNFDGGDLRGLPRPLHFVASFESNKPIGLTLSEASNENDSNMSEADWSKWKAATENSFPGEVFVKGFSKGGQADCMGIFEIGDRLRGVGELPFVGEGGFDGAVKLIEKQPKTAGSIRLHFDRQRSDSQQKSADKTRGNNSACAKITDQGVWKSKGRRGSQEDNFLLHEVTNNQFGDVLLCGVLDGHGGTAASESVSKILPPLFSEELELSSDEDVSDAIASSLEKSWDLTCTTYRSLCENGECVVDYDQREGILYAETGSKDLIAGTTATLAAISLNPSGTSKLAVLNCGDSRTLLVGEVRDNPNESVVAFETRDHSPDDELEIQRLQRGRDEGLDYSVPECAGGQSYLRVGDFQYALARSLEGAYVTARGIVSDGDVTILSLSNILEERQYCAMVLSCDGLFEVMSNEEVGMEVVRMRKEGYKAGEIAKNLCGQALKKGSYDNISTIVVYIDKAQNAIP